MPERWQRTLEQLRSVDTDQERTWARAQRPPTGEGLPPRRQRVVAGVVAFAVFAAAGAFAWQAIRPADDTTLIGAPGPTIVASFDVVPSAGVDDPQGHLTSDGGTIAGTVSSFTWEIPGGEMTSDAFGPDFRRSDYLPVERGSQLTVAGSADSVTGELQLPGTGSLPFERLQDFGTLTDSITLDAPPGRYVLHLTPTWPQGSVPFYFPIELVEPPAIVEPVASSTVVLNLTSDAAGPAASISWGDESRVGKRGEYKWCDGTGGCETGVPNWGPPVGPDSAQLSILAGTPLTITGEVTGLKGGFSKEGGRLVSNFELEAPGAVPDVPGNYLVEIHAAIEGTGSARGNATFWFSVDVVRPRHLDPNLEGLVGPNWVLSKINDVDVPGPSIPMAPDRITVTFAAERFSGSDGCNDFGGHYRTGAAVEPRGDASGSIAVVSLAGTQVACSGPVAMFTERMLGATDFFIEGDTLTIRSPTGLLTFEAG